MPGDNFVKPGFPTTASSCVSYRKGSVLFADPQSVTINAVAQTLPRVSTEKDSGVFRKDDANVELVVSHSYGKARNRRLLKLTHRKIAADPLLAGTNVNYSMTVTMVVDHPQIGYSIAEQKQIVDALTAYATASSGAKVTQLLGGEN